MSENELKRVVCVISFLIGDYVFPSLNNSTKPESIGYPEICPVKYKSTLSLIGCAKSPRVCGIYFGVTCSVGFGDFSNPSNYHRVPSCLTDYSHTDLAQCSLQPSSCDVGVSLLCSVQYWHCTTKHYYWWMWIMFGFVELIILHVTSVFVWIEFGHFGLNWSCN